MLNHVLLDTSAYAQFRRGQRDVVGLLTAAERIHLSTITLGELEAGFLLGSRVEENRRALRDLLSESFVSVVNVDASVAQRYGALFSQLRKAGTPVPTNDIWIAACALQVGATLVTFDTDFVRFRDLDKCILSP
jgi:tRNA(fMet)-specific endonuclease VapC